MDDIEFRWKWKPEKGASGSYKKERRILQYRVQRSQKIANGDFTLPKWEPWKDVQEAQRRKSRAGVAGPVD